MNRPVFVAALLAAAVLAACEKNAVQDLPLSPVATARIKFFNFGVGAPGVNFYAGETKMTAITSTSGTESTNGTTYPNAGNAGLYNAIAPGQYSLTGRIAATTDKNLPIDTLTGTIADGKAYSFYLSGVYNTTTKLTDAFIVEDPVPAQDFSVTYVRLVHAIFNADTLRLYARPAGDTATADWAPIGGPVAYKGAGAFATITPGIYDLGARLPGQATNRITFLGVSFLGGQIYTVAARGNNTGTTTATRDSITVTPNY